MKYILKYLLSNESFIIVMSELFEKCTEYEIISYIWKSTIAIPLHEKGLLHLQINYWLVPLTCILNKVFENLIWNHILNFTMEDINCNQHGFVNVKSILSNILESIDIINKYLTERIFGFLQGISYGIWLLFTSKNEKLRYF